MPIEYLLSSDQCAQLERLVDSRSLSAVLSELSRICTAKCIHIEENWQDAPLARLWGQASGVLETASNRPSVRRVSR